MYNDKVDEEPNFLINFVKKLRFFGHVKRHDSLEKSIVEGMVEWKVWWSGRYGGVEGMVEWKV